MGGLPQCNKNLWIPYFVSSAYSYSLVSWLLFCFAIFSHTYDKQIVNGAQLSSIIMLLACQ